VTWLKRAAKWAPVIALALLVVFWRYGVQRWLTVHTGSSNMPGTPPNYNFFSGSGSILLPWIGQGLIVGLLFWWHNQCGVHGCYWYAQRTTAAGDRACRRHHPNQRPTVEDIHAAHHAARQTESEDR
jgi:hypothetical protein